VVTSHDFADVEKAFADSAGRTIKPVLRSATTDADPHRAPEQGG
jgi:hypothetical protein